MKRHGRPRVRGRLHKYYLGRGERAFDFREEQFCFIVNKEDCFGGRKSLKFRTYLIVLLYVLDQSVVAGMNVNVICIYAY